MPQITSMRPPSIAEIARFDGVPPNMSVSSTTPLPSWTRATALENVGAALLHVVFGADRDRLELRLRSDDMLQRGAKAVASWPWVTRTIPIINDSIVFARRRRAGGGSRPCGGRIFVQLRRNDQAKFAKVTISITAP